MSDIYEAANKELANLLGIKWAPTHGWCNDLDEDTTDWCADSDCALGLMTEYELDLLWRGERVIAYNSKTLFGTGTDIAGHHDRLAAARYAIVLASIKVISEGKKMAIEGYPHIVNTGTPSSLGDVWRMQRVIEPLLQSGDVKVNSLYHAIMEEGKEDKFTIRDGYKFMFWFKRREDALHLIEVYHDATLITK